MASALRAATRKSTLARTQTAHVAELLDAEVEPVPVETSADRRPDTPIWDLGDRGAFVREVQAAVLDGRADFAVHSAKDLPSTTPDGLVIAAVPEREDPRDALVGATLETLPVGGRVGTGSVRRRAQLSWLRADLTFGGLRGNIETRLEKASEFDAIVVAFAALRRLGRTGAADEVLDVSLLVPQVGQGALAVECRADDERVVAILADADHEPSHVALRAERAWLAELGGGCDRPVGAYATVAADGTVRLIAMLSSGDGRLMVRRHDEGGDAEELGRALARQMLERAGGTMVLDEASPAVVPVPGLLR